MLAGPYASASSRSGRPGLGAAGCGVRLTLREWGKQSCPVAYLCWRPLCPSFPSVPPHLPLLPLWGCIVGRLLTIWALISLPGASWSGGAYQGSAPVRWAFRSPWARGGGGRSPCCRAWRLPHHPWAFTSPRPSHGLPSLPHQDTEHCMNSGLNGIISEFWSTASSGYFTNYLSRLCGGKSPGWGQVTDAGRSASTACGGSESLPTLLPLQGAPRAVQADTPCPASAGDSQGRFRKGGRRSGPGVGRVDRGKAKGGCQEWLDLGSIPTPPPPSSGTLAST